MKLTEQDAYALRRAVSMMDIPKGLTLSPMVESLLATLDWKNNLAHWSLQQQIITHDPQVSAQILRVDPSSIMRTTTETKDETFVPPLPKAAQLTDNLAISAETIGLFHRDCLAWLASTIFLPLSDALLHAVGWRTAVFILGMFLALVTIPLHALILRRPADMGLIPDGSVMTSTHKAVSRENVSLHGALHGRTFWLLTLGFCLASLSAAAVRVHFIPLLMGAGMNASTAALAAGTIGIMQVTGRVIFAPLDHRFSSNVIVIGIFALQSLAIVLLLLGQSPLLIGVFILVFGASQGAATLARPSILAERYGTSHHGRISSVMAIFLTLTATSAPLGASLLYDHFASYQPVLRMVLVFALAATGVVILAKRSVPRHQTSPLVEGELAVSAAAE